MSKPTIVLIHGAFRGGWAWQKVRRILQDGGYEVFAPSLTGAGEKKHLLSPDITLDTWTQDIVGLLDSEDLNDVTLVGHSQGGIVIQAAAEAAPERIRQLVFIDAPVLQNGECAIDVLPEEVRQKFGETPRNILISPIPIPANEHLSEEETGWISQRLTEVPSNPSLERVTIKHSLDIPHHYIFCLQTPSFYPSHFTRQRFDRDGTKYKLIDAPHDCIMTHAEMIAEMLARFAAKGS